MNQVNDAKEIDADILTIVGGNFTPVSLGPETYQAILDRAHARAKEYINRFEALFLGANFDALLQSRLHLPAFLELLADSEPNAVRATAASLLKQYDAVLVVYDEVKDKQALYDLLPEDSMRMFQRLESRRRSLQLLIERLSGQ